MKIICTGGSGFVGSNLINSLKKDFPDVEIKDISRRKGYDIRNFPQLLEETKGYDVVVHLAALISHPESMIKPREYYETDLMGTINVLECVKQNNIKKVIIASSSAIVVPDNPYAQSKLFSEHVADFYSRYIPEVYIARFFNIYGEGNRRTPMYHFFNNIKNGKSIIIHDNERITRDYVHVDDIVRSLKMMISGELKPHTYWIGTGIGTSLKDLANDCMEIAGKSVSIEKKGSGINQIGVSVGDQPFFEDMVNLSSEGLERVWKWIQNDTVV